MIPVTVVTGFLGSGKTTLLRRLLGSGAVRDVAVLVNEAAEAGIDQKLLGAVAQEVRVLENGCVCCSMREDLRASLAALLERRAGAISHVVIETTGLADPAPILDTFASDPMLRHQFRLGAVVTVVDGMHAATQRGAHREWIRQVAAADRIVLTKADLADEATLAAAGAAIAAVNPAAPVVSAALDDARLAEELLRAPEAGLDAAARFLQLLKAVDAPREGERAGDRPLAAGRLSPLAHGASVTPFCIAIEGAFDWAAFALWLTMLLHAHGDRVLRVKGILDVAGSDAPLVLNGVRGVIHRPEHLARWPEGERRPVLAFIVEDLEPERIRRSFAAFVG
jgi:G3E family GTPase